MKSLIVEDNAVCRALLGRILQKHGQCDFAMNGAEAVRLFCDALDADVSYDVVLLDIMMPELDGQETLCRIREAEAERGIGGLDGVKTVMTTALSDTDNVFTAFREQCDAYIVKPFGEEDVLRELAKLGFIS